MGDINYQANSHKSKEEQNALPPKKVEKVVKGTVKTKKKSDIQKLSDIFISEDVHNVKNYIFMDVLVPAIKKAVSDIVTNGIDMILYGESGRSKRNSPSSNVSYRNYYDRKREDDHRTSGSRLNNGYNYKDIVVETRAEAEEVLDRLNELIDMYGSASVADLYDLVGESGPYTNNKYGWYNIRNAEPVRMRDGYLLKLPKALPLD